MTAQSRSIFKIYAVETIWHIVCWIRDLFDKLVDTMT